MGEAFVPRNAHDDSCRCGFGPLEFVAYLVGIFVAFFLDAYLDVEVWRFIYHL